VTAAPLSSNGSGGTLKALKGQATQAEKDSNEETVPSTLQIVGDNSAGTRQFPVLEVCACRSLTGLSKYGNFRKKIP
jgi:hypothetical protein